MNNQYWLNELEMLLARFSYIGISADMATIGILEAWGLYCYLSRLAEV